MNLLENVSENKSYDQLAERYLKKYRSQIEALESSSMLSKIRSIQPFDIYAAGKQMETFEAYKQICEEDGTLQQLGTIPTIALDVISAAYGTSPLSVIASVQPIDEEQGVVYFKSIVAQTTKGNVTAGQAILRSDAIEDVAAVGYASNRITVTAATTVDATTSYNATLANGPIRPGSLQFTFNGLPNVKAMDDGQGTILGSGVVGTINYATGALALTFSSNPGAGNTVVVQYANDWTGSTDIPKVISKMTTKPVTARIFALKDTIGLDSSYALRRRFGIIAEDMAAEDLVSAINAETMNTAVTELAAKAVGNTNWSKTAPSGVSYFEHKQTVKDAFADADSLMLGNAGRGSANVLVAGRDAAAILSTLPGWVSLSDGSSVGPHIFGTLDGRIVVRVPNATVLAANKIILMYKGTSPFDSALVYAPYMPLLVTTALPNGINPLLNQKAAAVWAAIETLVPNFATTLTITS